MEDPILLSDFEGLAMLRAALGDTQLNSGEYLDVSGKRALIQAGGADMLNVHGHVTDVMRIGWLAADMGVEVKKGKIGRAHVCTPVNNAHFVCRLLLDIISHIILATNT